MLLEYYYFEKGKTEASSNFSLYSIALIPATQSKCLFALCWNSSCPPQKKCTYFSLPSKSVSEISLSYCGWAFSRLLSSFFKAEPVNTLHLSAGRIPPPAIDVPSQPELQIVQQLYHSLPLMMCRHPRSFATQHNTLWENPFCLNLR